MSNDTLVLRQCFEELAEKDIDIAPAVYAHFLADMPHVEQHIAYLDERMRGRMLDQIYNLLLGDVEEDYLSFEAKMHEGYGATPAMYRGVLDAVKQAVGAALGAEWSVTREAAWVRSIDSIVARIQNMQSLPAS